MTDTPTRDGTDVPDRPLADLTPAEVLQVALEESTTDQRCDEAWVTALAGRVLAATAPPAQSAELAAAEQWARDAMDRAVPHHLVTLLAEYARGGGVVVTGPSPRPTREQVEADLAFADDVGRGRGLDSRMARLAAEVRACWADLEAARSFDGAAEAKRYIAALAAERDQLRAALAARTPQPAPGTILAAWEQIVRLTGREGTSPASVVDAVAYATEQATGARTPQPAAVGRCGHPLTMFGRTSLCALPADHRGWHRDGATEWSDGSQPAAPQPAVPDGEDVPARLDAAADAYVLPDDRVAVQIDIIANALAAAGLRFEAKDLRHVARSLRQAEPEVRAAVAAALARPLGEQQ